MPTLSVSKDDDRVHVEMDFGTDEIGTIEELVQQVEDRVGTLIEEVIETGFEMKLEEDLGPRWVSNNTFEDKRCPTCGDQQAIRKEFRERSVTVSSDRTLSVNRPVVTCSECESEYRPYDKELGVSEDGHQYTVSTMLEVMNEAIRTTYAKASELFEHGPRPKTIWRYVSQWIPSCSIDEDGPSSVVVDGTQVPRWREPGQRVVSIAHGLSENEDGWAHQVVGTAFGEEVDIKPVLEDAGPSDLIHDGRLNLDDVAETTRRCRWHVPHSVRQLLYQDGITGDTNRWLVDQLEDLVWDDESDESNYRVQLIHWARRYEAYAPHAASHVRHAVEGLVTTRRRELQTTSLAEREMKEINKRLENGGGWTDHGGEAMIQHHQMLRHEPEEWMDQMTEILGNAMSASPRNSVI